MQANKHVVATTLLVTNVNRKITSATRECTIDNTAYSVFYAWLRSCLFYLQLKAVFGLSVPRSMGMTGAVTFTIVKSHSCHFLPLWPSEGHSWLDKIRHVEWTLAFDVSGCSFTATQVWSFWCHRTCLSVWTEKSIFYNCFKQFISIRMLLCWHDVQ